MLYLCLNSQHSLFPFAAFPISVTIVSVPDEGPDYTPGSTVLLMCSASGQFGPVRTTWTSTCTGDCFVLQQSGQSAIVKEVLHAVDGGNHTCTVVDDVGNTGNATFEMRVSGTYSLIIQWNFLIWNSWVLYDSTLWRLLLHGTACVPSKLFLKKEVFRCTCLTTIILE